MSRRPLLAGNWKMNMLRADAQELCASLVAGESPIAQVDVALFPPAVLIDTVAHGVSGSPIEIGGQDVHTRDSGAHTGDISAPQLRDAGCSWALCGHSERRRDHKESDELVAAKALAAERHGLRPMICLGETREQRKAGETFAVLDRQLLAVLEIGVSDLTVAYEPVWAIGTGETATPEIAQEAHAHLRALLAKQLGDARAQEIRLLYGGSAKPDNVAQLYHQHDIDGFLIGGASLDSTKFSAMIKTCAGIAG